MPGLRFTFSELIREARAFRGIAASFLDPASTWALDQLISDLDSVWGVSGGHTRTLQLRPLRTKPSKDYEAGNRRGGAAVFAIITGSWEVLPLEAGSKKPKAIAKRRLEFCGLASTKIELFASDNPDARLAMWRLELGAVDSPGCYVHMQILGDSNEPPFPRTLPIPRLPSFFVTPTAAIEYVLGELFQDQWERAATQSRGDLPFWRQLQTNRLRRLLSWQQQLLEDVLSSPWMTLKAAMPDSDLFLP